MGVLYQITIIETETKEITTKMILIRDTITMGTLIIGIIGLMMPSSIIRGVTIGMTGMKAGTAIGTTEIIEIIGIEMIGAAEEMIGEEAIETLEEKMMHHSSILWPKLPQLKKKTGSESQ